MRDALVVKGLAIPQVTDTTTTFAFSPKLGRYGQSGVKSSSSMCHHQQCAHWHCTPAS